MSQCTTAFAAMIHQEVMSALRAGTSIELIVHALGTEIERLQIAAPLINAINEFRTSP